MQTMQFFICFLMSLNFLACATEKLSPPPNAGSEKVSADPANSEKLTNPPAEQNTCVYGRISKPAHKHFEKQLSKEIKGLWFCFQQMGEPPSELGLDIHREGSQPAQISTDKAILGNSFSSCLTHSFASVTWKKSQNVDIHMDLLIKKSSEGHQCPPVEGYVRLNNAWTGDHDTIQEKTPYIKGRSPKEGR